MPAAPRPNNKATKIAYSILGKPAVASNRKSEFRYDRPQYGITYGHKLVGTILR